MTAFDCETTMTLQRRNIGIVAHVDAGIGAAEEAWPEQIEDGSGVLARYCCHQAAFTGTGSRSAFVLSTRLALSARSMLELASNASAVPLAGG